MKWPDDAAATLAGLREAYGELEATKPLRDLGRSVSFINHEIKNYITVISGCAMLMRRSKNLDDRDRGMVDSIVEAAAKLQDLSTELSRAKPTPRDSVDFDLVQALNSCVERHFAEHASKFTVQNNAAQDMFLVIGNPEKLERAFISVFQNSLEAGAQKINVKLFVYNYVALIVVDDDGEGCGAVQYEMMSETFFTTKQRPAGMGLGFCIIRSIVEAHYGNVSVYSKNLLDGDNRGMAVSVMIPASKRMPQAETESEIMLIREGLEENETAIHAILKNIKIIPHTAETPKSVDFGSRSASLTLTVFAAPPQAAALREKAGDNPNVRILSMEKGEGGILIAVDANNNRRDLFNEEFVIRISTMYF